jgi:hypothetical protein
VTALSPANLTAAALPLLYEKENVSALYEVG